MAHSSHARSNISIDLFNLPSLPDERRTMTMNNDLPNDFYLSDGKNSKISQIVNKWICGRQTPDGNEGVGSWNTLLGTCHMALNTMLLIKSQVILVQSTKITLNPQITLRVISPFNLKELEFHVCRIADHHNGRGWFLGWMMTGDGSALNAAFLSYSQPTPDLAETIPHELWDMVQDGHVFSMEQHTNLYFHHVEVINDLVESFQMYATYMYYHPDSAAGIQAQTGRTNIILWENNQKYWHSTTDGPGSPCIHEGLPQVPSPRYIAYTGTNLKMIILDLFCSQPMEMQMS